MRFGTVSGKRFSPDEGISSLRHLNARSHEALVAGIARNLGFWADTGAYAQGPGPRPRDFMGPAQTRAWAEPAEPKAQGHVYVCPRGWFLGSACPKPLAPWRVYSYV